MISSLRKRLASGLVLVILGLGIISLVFTDFGTSGVGGIGALSGGGSADAVATIEGKDLPASEVQDEINRRYQAARQQQPTLDLATFLADDSYGQLLNQMITLWALDQYGRERGLVVSQTLVDRMIVNIPQFRNFTGQFDNATFRQELAAQNMTEAQFREQLTRQLMQRQLLAPIALGGRVPLDIARYYSNVPLERRRGSIGMVAAAPLAAGVAPTNAEIAAFYRANRAAFTIPERRVVRYALVGPEQVAQAGAATDAEIAQAYRANQGRFGARDVRTLQHLVVQDRRQAQAAVQQLRGGASFAEVTSRLGFAASDLTFADQTREAFAGQAPAPVAQTAFATAQGQVAGPISFEGRFHIVRVERVNTLPARSLESARAEIATFIERRKKVEALDDLVTRIEDQLAEGANFEQVARAERLAVVTSPPITAAGRVAGGQPVQITPELQRMLPTAFAIDSEELRPVVEQLEANNRFALLDVQRVDAAAPPPLAQVVDRVRAALIQRRSIERARALADGIARRVNAGIPIARAFAEAQPRLPAPEMVTRERADVMVASAPPAPLAALFDLRQGRARVVAAPDRAGFYVVFLAERTPGNAATIPQLAERTRAQFMASLSEEMAQQFARSVELRSEISRNEDAIRRARAAIGGGGTE